MKQLSAFNPLDYIRLLWWVLVMPQQLIDYREKFGKEDEWRISKWLVSTFAWLPLLIPSLALGLGLLPESGEHWLPETYFWMSAGLVGCWLLLGWLADSDEKWALVLGVLLVGGVAGSVMGSVIGDVGVVAGGVAGIVGIVAGIVVGVRGVVMGVAGLVASVVAFIIAIIMGINGGALVGVAIGVAYFVAMAITEVVDKSLEIGKASWFARVSFLLLISAHIFLIFYCFGGWRLFV
jgi:hypothetical protein